MYQQLIHVIHTTLVQLCLSLHHGRVTAGGIRFSTCPSVQQMGVAYFIALGAYMGRLGWQSGNYCKMCLCLTRQSTCQINVETADHKQNRFTVCQHHQPVTSLRHCLPLRSTILQIHSVSLTSLVSIYQFYTYLCHHPSLFHSRLKTTSSTNPFHLTDFWYPLDCLHGSSDWAGLTQYRIVSYCIVFDFEADKFSQFHTVTVSYCQSSPPSLHINWKIQSLHR